MSTFASQTLTLTGVPLNTETVTVGGKTYQFQTSLTNVDGNVFIGISAAASLQNLKDAINLSGIPNVQYGALTTPNTQVVAHTLTATTLLFVSKVPGILGNFIVSTETITNGSFGAGTLAGGTGDLQAELRTILAMDPKGNVAQAIIDISDPEGNE